MVIVCPASHINVTDPIGQLLVADFSAIPCCRFTPHTLTAAYMAIQ